ncbi:MAG TPA: GAF domain-containing sensor histidine kinase, partial [Pyrinomonadaceae bacterium]|nr:GAF domain-containing sensor histidine kinase [Pyrinomonadaceae bacterium]
MPLPDLTALAASPSLELVSPFISRITRAHTLSGVAQALAQTTPAQLVSFDRCCLVIPAANAANHEDANASMRSLSVERGADRVSVGLFRAAHSPFARALEQGVAVVLDETTLRDTAEITGHDARAALALPLTNGTETFGALCFTSATAGVYDDQDTCSLAWLADAVALAVGACLSRERVESGNEARRELERLKSGFVNTLVRDIRMPLTNVLGLLELFESKLQAREPFDMEDRQLLGSAIEQGGRMRQLADNLLEIARQQEQTLALNVELAATEKLLEDAVEPLRGEAALRGVELNVRVAAGTSDLHVDVRQTRRAICHLICVALAATPAGGSIQIEAQSITGTRLGDEGQRFVVVNVADSGAGISPEEIPFVFDAFWHVSDARRTNAGRGIGLAIAKRIAAAHGGNVSVRSQRG